MAQPLFHIVLYRPEIPNNTGNIGRTCVALGCALHLIHPLGFEISEKACRRAGLDYWPRLTLFEHADWSTYVAATAGARRWFLSTRGRVCLFDAELAPGDHFIFGPETSGLPEQILTGQEPATVRLPMLPGERSLNLATVACTVAYEGVRQLLVRKIVGIDAGFSLNLP
ncbi:MAG: tRNA (cytidine(34)-2'-O)-methyltransferase [Phycisphaeraceae bacterium]|nr:tRNA (cytidine(34)-2'-O)-methyltransferase [Phycisphaeraceae bacterium]MCW5753809.1 tRNA (cytidine(34)-2'-O)-methyltransferase [Phycisphaeraceae bacterium]